MPVPVIINKVKIPTEVSTWVVRDSLLARLSTAKHHRLIMICCPGGYGKTVLLTQWAHRADLHTAWYTLDSRDNDSNLFLTYLVAAFKKAGVVGEQLLKEAQESLPAVSERVWAELLNQIQHFMHPITLVLDNVDQIKAPRVKQRIQRLLDEAPDNLHLALASRARPNIALSRLRTENQLVEFELTDLAFNADDTAKLCNLSGFETTPAAVRHLNSCNEGWITGIQLWGSAYQKLRQSDELELDHSHVAALAEQYISTYFQQEILEQLNESLRDLLYDTSVVDAFNVGLVKHLNPQSKRDPIARLLQHNLFVQPHGHEIGWHRYHPMFQCYLYKQLKQTDLARTQELHRLAVEWFLQKGRYAEGLQQYGRCHDFKALLRFIEKHTFDLVREGEVNDVVNLIETIPQELTDDHHTLAIIEASAIIISNDLNRIKSNLSRLKRLLKPHPLNSNPQQRLSQTVAYLRARQADLGGNLRHCISICDAELLSGKNNNAALSILKFFRASSHFGLGELSTAKRNAEQSLHELRLFGVRGLPNYLDFLLGQIEIAQGQVRQAEARFVGLRPSGDLEAVARNFYDLFYFLGLGLARLEINRLDSAERLLDRAALIAMAFRPAAILPWVLHHQARLYWAQAKPEQADKAWAEAQAVATKNKLWGVYRLCGAYRVRLAVERDDETAINVWLSEWDRVLRLYGIDTMPEERLAYCWVEYHRRNWQDAHSSCELLISALDKQNHQQLLIDAYLLQSRLQWSKDLEEIALHSLDKAVELAAESNLHRLFFHERQNLFELFQLGLSEKAFQQQGTTQLLKNAGPIRKLLFELKSEASSPSPFREQPLPPPFDQLSKRELDVLFHIVEGRRNQEIAEFLFIGISTVKTHINSIFRKLNTDSREGLIQKACLLQLTKTTALES